MKISAALAVASLFALAACGNAQFEDGFNKAFEKSAKEACVKSAAQSGAPADKIEPYCACFVGQLAGLSVQEKMSLDPKAPKIEAAAKTCLAQQQPA